MGENGGLNIAAVAKRTGVAPDTLRKWESRYGVLTPARSPGGQRRYTEVDVARIVWLRDRLEDGYRVAQAAALLKRSAIAPRSAGELQAALVAAARAGDADEVDAVLDHAFSGRSATAAMSQIAGPALVEIGTAWEAGEVSVAQEHLVSAAVRARLGHALSDTRGAARGTAVLACAPGELHELGLMTLALHLAGDGWRVVYLGQNTPVGDAAAAADAARARLLAISVTMADRIGELADALRETEQDRRCEVIVGGSPVDRKLAGVLGVRHVSSKPERATAALGRLLS